MSDTITFPWPLQQMTVFVPKVAKYKKKTNKYRLPVIEILALYMADLPKMILTINKGLTLVVEAEHLFQKIETSV